ncbi:STAS domain-containing protein [Streptomyces shenzhenensis]|uniref:STAS domain-containing protein n=1 Tax=Streptomyces shenzhenensis TaxID=943815 RepID=UPI0015F06D87|nr:STAS domain-containing protein [Streptomyces shenzhenensis]
MAENHTGSMTYRTTRTDGGATVVTLHGDLDLLAVPVLSAALDDLTSGAEPDLVLDLSPVSFVDSSGLSLLCRAHNRVRYRIGRLRLVTPDDGFCRLLRRTGLGDTFELYPDLARAFARSHPYPSSSAPRRSPASVP